MLVLVPTDIMKHVIVGQWDGPVGKVCVVKSWITKCGLFKWMDKERINSPRFSSDFHICAIIGLCLCPHTSAWNSNVKYKIKIQVPLAIYSQKQQKRNKKSLQ